MRVRNYLPKDDPYAQSKTKLQWRKEGRALKDDAIGKELWNNRNCQVYVRYYTLDETRPATPEDVVAWREERRTQIRKRREAKLAEEARERNKIEQLVARLRQHIGVKPADVICLDTETTGLEAGYDELLQLSIINGNGDVLFNEYIRPKNATEWPGAEAVNGISPAMVADKPHIDEYIPRLNRILAAAKLIVGYNVGFDLGFIRWAGIEIPKETPTFDVMKEFAEIYGEWSEYHKDYRWQKLYVCSDFFGYEGSGNFHDSLEDVRATLYCYYKMTKVRYEDTP